MQWGLLPKPRALLGYVLGVGRRAPDVLTPVLPPTLLLEVALAPARQEPRSLDPAPGGQARTPLSYTRSPGGGSRSYYRAPGPLGGY